MQVGRRKCGGKEKRGISLNTRILSETLNLNHSCRQMQGTRSPDQLEQAVCSPWLRSLILNTVVEGALDTLMQERPVNLL